jgi:hypothetical protein
MTVCRPPGRACYVCGFNNRNGTNCRPWCNTSAATPRLPALNWGRDRVRRGMTTSESVGHSKTCSLWLQKSPSRNFWKMAEILSTFQRSFFNRECGGSNPPRSANQSLNCRLLAGESDKCPPIGALCELAMCLYTPNLNNLRAKLPIVSGLHLKYSRFLETRARDRARSALRGVGRSLAQPFLRKRSRGP